MENAYLKLITQRRSCYDLDDKITQSEAEIFDIVARAQQLSPAAFGAQSARTRILFGELHHALWDETERVLKSMLDESTFAGTREKIRSFARAAGTVLFFEDHAVTEDLQAKFPTYRDNFPIWAMQSQGIAQFNIWTALANENIGASLQHYNPLADKWIKEKFQIPEKWQHVAQMPFGHIATAPAPKDYPQDPSWCKVEH